MSDGNEAGHDHAETMPSADAPGTPVKWVRWNAAMRDRFFDHLATSCNVAASAAEVGVRPSQVQHRRRTNPAFAALWEQAIAAGYQLLEMRLIGHVLAGGGPSIAPSDPDAVEALDWEGAIKLLTIHKARREGRGGRPGPVPGTATREQTDAVILRKLATLAAGRARLTPPPQPEPQPEPRA